MFWNIFISYFFTVIEAKNKGLECKGSNIRKVPCDVPCKWSQWSDWSECCPEGTMERTRTKLQFKRNRGQDCEGDDKEIQNCRVDCQYGEWGQWSHCSKPGTTEPILCGQGEETRKRNMIPAANGGQECRDEELTEIRPCYKKKCCLKIKDPLSYGNEGQQQVQDDCLHPDDFWL